MEGRGGGDEARSLKEWLKNDVGRDPSLLLWDTNRISLWTIKMNNFVILNKGYHNNTYKESEASLIISEASLMKQYCPSLNVQGK